jgi:hypothetical protein
MFKTKNMENKTFNVNWEIEVTATSPKEAARLALEIQRDPSSEAVNFDVEELGNGEKTEVDLSDETTEALTGIRQKLEALEEILDTNSSRKEWSCDGEVSMEMDYIYGKVNEIKKDLESL